MRIIICILLFIFLFLVNFALAFSFDMSEKNKYAYEYHLLPSTDFKNFSSALYFYYPVRERTGFELQYISIDNVYFGGNSYFFSYYLLYGLEKKGFILGDLVFGYRNFSPIGSSNFADRKYLLIGLRNQI